MTLAPTRWSSLALLSILSVACGDDTTPSPMPEGDAGNGSDAAAPLDAAAPSSDAAVPDAARLDAAAVDARVAPTADGGSLALFDDEPTCPELGGKLDGVIEDTTVRVTLAANSFQTLQSELSSIPGDYLESQGDFKLTWSESLYTLTPRVSPLTGGTLRFPEIIDAGPYCVVAGRISLLSAVMLRESYQVEITSVRKANGDTCEGPELPASVRGCFELEKGGFL